MTSVSVRFLCYRTGTTNQTGTPARPARAVNCNSYILSTWYAPAVSEAPQALAATAGFTVVPILREQAGNTRPCFVACMYVRDLNCCNRCTAWIKPQAPFEPWSMLLSTITTELQVRADYCSRLVVIVFPNKSSILHTCACHLGTRRRP